MVFASCFPCARGRILWPLQNLLCLLTLIWHYPGWDFLPLELGLSDLSSKFEFQITSKKKKRKIIYKYKYILCNIWDILILLKYVFFIWNSNLTRHYVFYLATVLGMHHSSRDSTMEMPTITNGWCTQLLLPPWNPCSVGWSVSTLLITASPLRLFPSQCFKHCCSRHSPRTLPFFSFCVFPQPHHMDMDFRGLMHLCVDVPECENKTITVLKRSSWEWNNWVTQPQRILGKEFSTVAPLLKAFSQDSHENIRGRGRNPLWIITLQGMS